MKVEVERQPRSRAVLQVELPADEVSHAMEAAQRRLALRVRIPGFRQGKAPATLVARYVSRESVVDEALKVLLPEGFERAMQEAGLVPIGRPEIDVDATTVSEEAPLRFTATVDLVPQVELGDYRALRVPQEAPAVGETDVARMLEDLRLRQGTLVPVVDEPAARGDFVLIRVVEAAGLERLQAGKEYLVEVGAGTYPEPLEESLVGIRRGEERTVPLGNEDARVTVVAGDVKRRELPPLDETFARQVGAESLEALREQTQDRLRVEAERRSTEAYQDAVVRAAVEQATVDLPQSLVGHEVEHLMADFQDSLNRRGLTLQTYLRASDRTEEDVHAEFEAIAERRLRAQLVLAEIAKRERIEPTQQEIDKEVENLAQSLQQDGARVREWLGEERRRDALVNSLRRRKTVQFLVALASSSATSDEPAASALGTIKEDA